ncbi:MAG: MBG domain-containing protein, partial [Chitinophagaceae bacterium]
ESFGTIGLTGTPTYLTDADEFSPVADYTIIPSKGTMSAPNYDFQFVNGKLSVAKATVTVKAVDTTRYYCFANPVFRAAFSGFRNNEDFASSGIVGYPSLTVAADESTPIGAISIVAAVGNNFTSRNYQFVFQNGSMNILKAVLTVKADRLEKFYGDPRPDLTYSITGFRPGESFGGSIASGEPVLQNTVDEFSIPGKYPITISLGTLQAGNYDFTLLKDSMVVKKAPLTVKALPATREYGEANPAFSAVISGYKNGQDSASSGYTGLPGFTTIAGPSTPVNEGGYPILPTLGSLAAQNYSFAFDTASLTITRAPLKVYAVDTFRSYGYPNPAFRANY